MDTENEFAEWVCRAQLGDRVSLDRLAEGARQRLYAYIYRLTMNHADFETQLFVAGILSGIRWYCRVTVGEGYRKCLLKKGVPLKPQRKRPIFFLISKFLSKYRMFGNIFHRIIRIYLDKYNVYESFHHSIKWVSYRLSI